MLAAFGLALLVSQAAGQTSAIDSEIAASDPTKEVAVSPAACDTQIADRLTRILDASDWFTDARALVREGIVFLDGTTETEERREWARQLALRTEDVVAVVNRIEVEPTISWDLTPTWRELERLAERVQWFAPLTVVSLLILFVTWLVSRGVAGLARHALRRRMASPLLVTIAARGLTIPVILIGIYLSFNLRVSRGWPSLFWAARVLSASSSALPFATSLRTHLPAYC